MSLPRFKDEKQVISFGVIVFLLVSIPLTTYLAIQTREPRSQAAISYTLDSFNVLSGSENPIISGNKIVWTSSNSGPNRNLFLRDLTTGVTTQVTNDTKYFYHHDLDGEKLVWQESGTNKIWYKNLITGEVRQLGIGWYPAVSGDRIVWWNYNIVGGVEADGITLYNLASSTSTLLPNTKGYFWDLDLEGTKLIITGGGIHYYNLTNNSKVKVSTETSTESSENGVVSGDFIIWQKSDNFGNYSEIWKYQISTGAKAKISTQQRAFRPRIDQNKVVWVVPFEGNIGFYIYDLSANIERKLDPYASNHYEFLGISGGKVVWLSYEGVFPFTEKVYVYEESGGGTKLGDINGDGSVGILDLSILLSTWDSTTDLRADLNSSGRVDILDLSTLLSKWGT